jgi:hypothetical protein
LDERGLRAALDQAGVPEADYVINTRHAPPLRRSGDHYYLDPQGQGWLVGVHERGQDRPLRRFTDQAAAFRFLYDRLTPRGPGPQPGAARRLSQISADQAEIQRAAWAAFERAGDESDDQSDARPHPPAGDADADRDRDRDRDRPS